MMRKTTNILLFLLLLPFAASAQEITNARMIGIGTSNILDTYLSPEKYKGTDIRYISHTLRKSDSCSIIREIIHQGEFATVDNRSGNGHEIGGMYNFQYGWHYSGLNFATPCDGRLQIEIGGNIDLNLGFLYNNHNSNNPAQARAYLNITPTAAADWLFHISNRPFRLRYEIGIPVCGLMFSPNYGQSYYEIFSEGNYDHNAVVTWPGNQPSMRHTLTFDFNLIGTTFRIGYLGDYQQAKVNSLKQHQYTHAVIFGIVKRFRITKLK